MLLGLNLQLQLCRALGFLRLKGRFKNPPVMRMLEGGSEPHIPRTGRAAAPEQRGKGRQLSSRGLEGVNRNAKFN